MTTKRTAMIRVEADVWGGIQFGQRVQITTTRFSADREKIQVSLDGRALGEATTWIITPVTIEMEVDDAGS